MNSVFNQIVLSLSLVLLAGACAATSAPNIGRDEARLQVQQLMMLYDENRPKFVLQKQKLEQAKSCSRAEALRQAVVELEEEAAMSPEKNETLIKVSMELQHAEKKCQEK